MFRVDLPTTSGNQGVIIDISMITHYNNYLHNNVHINNDNKEYNNVVL